MRKKATTLQEQTSNLATDYLEYSKRLEEGKQTVKSGSPKRLLLHSCCAPCSSGVLEELSKAFSITVFFCNPNIDDREEYEKRKTEQIRLLSQFPTGEGCLPVSFLEGPYQPERFVAFAKELKDLPEGGQRCALCFALRLEETAKAAKAQGFDAFATTLTVSPLKNATLINQIGRQLGEKQGISYLPSNFKKKNGYLTSLRNSKKFDLYRQNYCGCSYSKQFVERKEDLQ